MARDPRWYQEAVIYEIRVRSYSDGNGDGIGDLRGLIGRLDYLAWLGVSAIWLLPFYPSPLHDDGYDIADFKAVHPDCGTLSDVSDLLSAAHAKGIRVITELVLNHTSMIHPWFQRARQAPVGSAERDWFLWSESPDRLAGVRIIFRDFEPSNWTWDEVAGAYYFHRFFRSQPDLNYDSPAVRSAIFDVVDFWLGLGVDGLRLDAVPYLFKREDTSCESLPETHAFLRTLREHVDGCFADRMLLAEANQWPQQTLAYFGSGDECHMAFNFPLMPRLFQALATENSAPVVELVDGLPVLPAGCQWANFLRNHDELSLEMVSPQDRQLLWEYFAPERRYRINLGIRRRLAPLVGGDRRAIELLNLLMLTLPGTPVIYYGDEIGMGDNVYLPDRNGVRTPMQWSGDRNSGFSCGNPQSLTLPVVTDPAFHFAAINVEAQTGLAGSLLEWTRRALAVRRPLAALFGQGELRCLRTSNPSVLAFVRTWLNDVVLVVANFGAGAQGVDLDLSNWSGLVPDDLWGGGSLPPITDQAYRFVLGAYAIHWFRLLKVGISLG